ncbi:MAG TPA: preprotein translocase subunit SecG [Blattabacteriaceae bacterium]
MFLYVFLAVILIFTCLLLTVVITIQNPKRDSLSYSSLGDKSIQIFGVQRVINFWEKLTCILAILIFIFIYFFNKILKNR